MTSSHLILHHLLLLLPSIFPRIRVFSNESAFPIRWPKYWGFRFSISPSSEYSVLISFRIDWFDLLAVQGPLKSLLQHHSSKASILWRSAFFSPTLTSIHDHWKNVMVYGFLTSLLCPFPRRTYPVMQLLGSSASSSSNMVPCSEAP